MGILESIKEGLIKGVGEFTNEVKRDVRRKVDVEVKRVEKRLVRSTISIGLLLIGILFIAISFVYFFVEYLELTRTLAFFIVGAVGLILGIIIKLFK
ncbi:MAG: hypothetical protein Q7S27_01325 [Nanoarchaeota archaeon]|nr:hypothetical protein [Nanoarchaeota archaeon]